MKHLDFSELRIGDRIKVEGLLDYGQETFENIEAVIVSQGPRPWVMWCDINYYSQRHSAQLLGTSIATITTLPPNDLFVPNQFRAIDDDQPSLILGAMPEEGNDLRFLDVAINTLTVQRGSKDIYTYSCRP